MAGGSGFITAADASIVLTCPPIFVTGQHIQGFAPDDVFEVPAQRIAQVEMGVDGFLATGYIFVAFPWNFTLQASSPSVEVFDAVKSAQDAALTTFFWQGLISAPALGTTWTLIDGTLVDYAAAPPARQVFQPRKFGMVWRRIVPAPNIAALI
jgi:hypothetical protein